MADFSTVHPIEFANKVRDMRVAQQKFFKLRTSLYMQKAVALEKEVDDMLSKIHGPEQPPQAPVQTDIFG